MAWLAWAGYSLDPLPATAGCIWLPLWCYYLWCPSLPFTHCCQAVDASRASCRCSGLLYLAHLCRLLTASAFFLYTTSYPYSGCRQKSVFLPCVTFNQSKPIIAVVTSHNHIPPQSALHEMDSGRSLRLLPVACCISVVFFLNCWKDQNFGPRSFLVASSRTLF